MESDSEVKCPARHLNEWRRVYAASSRLSCMRGFARAGRKRPANLRVKKTAGRPGPLLLERKHRVTDHNSIDADVRRDVPLFLLCTLRRGYAIRMSGI
jgi:hypothetical protein